jgi:hypothetical protein
MKIKMLTTIKKKTFPKNIFKPLYKCFKQIISLFIIAFQLNLLPRIKNKKYLLLLLIGILSSLIIRLNLLHKFNIYLPEIYLLILNLFSVLYACYLLFLYVIICRHAYILLFKFKHLYKNKDKQTNLNILYISIIYYSYFIYISFITIFIIYINYVNIQNVSLFEYFYLLVLLISFLFAFDYSMYKINLNYNFNRNISNLGIIFFVSIILVYFGYLYSIYNGFLFKILQKFSIFGTVYCDSPPTTKEYEKIDDIVRGPSSDYSVTLHSKELKKLNKEELELFIINNKINKNNVNNENNFLYSDEFIIDMLNSLSIDTSNRGLIKLHTIFIKKTQPVEIHSINLNITQDNYRNTRNQYYNKFIVYLSNNLNLLDDKIINNNTKIDLLDHIRKFRAKEILSKDQRLSYLYNNVNLKIQEIFSLSISTLNTLNISKHNSLLMSTLDKINGNVKTTFIKNKEGSYMKYIPLNRQINSKNVVNVKKLIDLYNRDNNIFVNILPGSSGIYAYHEQGLRIFFPSKQFKSNVGGWCSIFNENNIKRYSNLKLKQDYILRISNIENLSNLSNLSQQAIYADKSGHTIIKYQDNFTYKSEFNENKMIYKNSSFEFLCDSGSIIRMPIIKNNLKITQYGLSQVLLLIKYFPFDPIIPGDDSSLKENLIQILQEQWKIKPTLFFYEQFHKNEGYWFNMDFVLNYKDLLSPEEYIKITQYLSDYIIQQNPINKEIIGKFKTLTEILYSNSLILMNNVAQIRVLNVNKNDFSTISFQFKDLKEVSKHLEMRLLQLTLQNNDSPTKNLDNERYLLNFYKGLNKFKKIVKKYI